MSHQTRMLIITSNEDLIDQLSSTKSHDTRVIQLNDSDSVFTGNSSACDLNCLAQLSELNSKNDQMYKRVLSSPRNVRSKVAKIPKKFTDLVCVICGDRAIGFNYDLLTCASCKAFFRRNAQHQPEKLRCLTGEKNCSVDHRVARKCQRCRLEKCFSLGMRKDFIHTEEEKQKRKQRLEENRQLLHGCQTSTELVVSPNIDPSPAQSNDQISMDTVEQQDPLSDEPDLNSMETSESVDLSLEDWLDIENVHRSYASIFADGNPPNMSFTASDRASALVCWSEFVNEKILRLINYFRQIDEFERLNSDDRFVLIKYNLLALYLTQKCHYYNPLTGTFRSLSAEEQMKRRQFFSLCYGASGICQSFKSVISSLAVVAEKDSTFIELLLLVLLFSKGLSMNGNEPFLKDSLSVYRAQSHYLKLLWNHLICHQGEQRTIHKFTHLLTRILQLQSLMTKYRDFFQEQMQSTEVIERFPPLMQAVLHIS